MSTESYEMYLEKYMKKHELTREEAEKHKLIHIVKESYEEEEKENEN